MEKYAVLWRSIRKEVVEMISQQFPLSDETLQFLRKDGAIFSTDQEIKIRQKYIEQWITQLEKDVIYALHDTETRSAVLGDFVEEVLERMNTDFDRGYKKVSDTGIKLPSEVMRRTSFMNIYSADPISIHLNGKAYLAFYVPEDDTQAYEGDDDDIHDSSPDEDEDDTVYFDDDQDWICSVDDPQNYFVVLNQEITQQVMHLFFTDPRFSDLARAYVEEKIIFLQSGLLDTLKVLFDELAAAKIEEISVKFDESNQELNELFWLLLHKELSKKKNTLSVQWLKEYTADKFLYPKSIRYHLHFKMNKNKSISVLIASTGNPNFLGETTIQKKKKGKNSWGSRYSTESEEETLNMTESILFDLGLVTNNRI